MCIRDRDDGHCLKQLLSTSLRKGLRFCPLSYLSVLSKELSRQLDGFCLSEEANCSVVAIMKPAKVVQGSLLSIDSFGYHRRSSIEKQKAFEEVCSFVEAHKGSTVMVFTDGSVYDGAVGCGACSAVLVPLHGDADKYYGSKCVGKKVSSLTCELEGIIYGLELSVNYFTLSKHRQESERLFIICDCSQAIEFCVKRSSAFMRPELIKRLLFLEESLSEIKVSVTTVWIPGHHEYSLMTLQIAWLKIRHVISTQEEYQLLVSSLMMMLSKLQVTFP